MIESMLYSTCHYIITDKITKFSFTQNYILSLSFNLLLITKFENNSAMFSYNTL